MKKKIILQIILFSNLFCLICFQSFGDKLSSFERAKLHPLTSDRPAVHFFEGALLGNGGLGAVVTTRPDGILIHFGHNNVWDIRIAENNKEKIGTFDDVFSKVRSIPDSLKVLTEDDWYREYSIMTAENYRKPYPRPFPCGSLLLGFDRRNAELLGHKLDISNGLCEVYLLRNDGRKVTLQVFTDMREDRLWIRLTDENGHLCENIFDRVKVIPDPTTPREFPKYKTEENLDSGSISFRQTLPYEEPEFYDIGKGHPKDKAFRLSAVFSASLEKTTRINWKGVEQEMAPLEGSFASRENLIGCVLLSEGLDSVVEKEATCRIQIDNNSCTKAFGQGEQVWRTYWEKSGVFLDDGFLEQIWYQNLYFLNCAVKDGVSTPGLFANWSYRDIGTAWHGDYHMNYNTQQPFWVTFSGNHLEKNLLYVNLVEFLMDVSQKWAKEYYKLPGAYFPHSAYPVDMNMNPYPVPTWGWEICETPWAVQGLWWHYLYSADMEYLRNRAYGPIKAAVEFLVAYMKRTEAHGPEWNDGKYHIFPTVPPELYGLRPGFKYNYDCNADLSLTKFIFKAFLEASNLLEMNIREEQLIKDVKEILSNFPDYSVANSKDHGHVFVSAPGEHAEVVYNVPLALFSVFPGEDHGLHSDPETMDLLRNSYRNQQNEGGNDLVFHNLQAARIGMLDLEKFKRQVNYCLLPNGTASDKVLQVHGRYNDLTDYGYMDKMGVWFENFALPAVINECLMQSYNGTIRLFPNWPLEKDAEFSNLRAAGAFLVSASLRNGKVSQVEIFSEAGKTLKIRLPWKETTIIKNNRETSRSGADMIEISTGKGERISFKPVI
ncbi:MAG: glycoside hydrolase N-terminal domain-containing protein [Prolixibacteraceae bacterium]